MRLLYGLCELDQEQRGVLEPPEHPPPPPTPLKGVECIEVYRDTIGTFSIACNVIIAQVSIKQCSTIIPGSQHILNFVDDLCLIRSVVLMSRKHMTCGRYVLQVWPQKTCKARGLCRIIQGIHAATHSNA